MTRFRVLLPVGGDIEAADYVAGLGLRELAPAARPYVVLNMVVSVDGRASFNGRTGPLANAADHELFHTLRTAGDAVLVGAATIRAEGYGETDRLVAIASNSLDLPTTRGVLRHPGNRVVVITGSDASVKPSQAQVGYVREELPEALRVLRTEYDVRAVVCEGGPHLNGQLLAAGLVDELFVTIAGRLAAGESPLTMVHGLTFEHPLELTLVALLEHDGFLFARYSLTAREDPAQLP